MVDIDRRVLERRSAAIRLPTGSDRTEPSPSPVPQLDWVASTSTRLVGIGNDIRIALVHSFYSSDRPSGENNVVSAELEALRDAGHDAHLIAVSTDDLIDRYTYRLRSALRVATGMGRDPLAALERLAPDVVHIHNLFPNFGRRWVQQLDVPVVHTVHNYRPLCANGRLLRDGEICTLCPDGRPWSGVRYGCYRDSPVATLPLALANLGGPAADPVVSRADRLIVLSDRQRQLYERAGAPGDRMTVWPNFLPASLDPGSRTEHGDAGWLFVGRLSEEKGVLRLVERWPAHERLRIVGDGPQRGQVAATAGPNVELLGPIERDDILDLMRNSTGLMFPSLWYEPSATPLVYVEALAAGLPVIAFPPSPVVESVRHDGTGVTASWDGDIGQALDAVRDRSSELRERCREMFERRHTEAAYLDRATATYERTVHERTQTPA